MTWRSRTARIRIIFPLILLLTGLLAAQIQIPLVTMRGTLRVLNKKEIIIDAGDEKLVIFRRLKKTKFLKGSKEIPESDLTVGAELVVEASRERDGEFDAVNVFLGELPDSPSPR
jgi:hypothetical protein